MDRLANCWRPSVSSWLVDRACFKISRIDQFVADTQDFFIRIKENVELSAIRSPQRQKQAGSRVIRRLGTPQSRSEKQHRVVFFHDHEREIRVLTSLMNMSAEEVAEMYTARWTVESFFRWIEHVPVLFGTTSNAVFN